MFILSVVPQGLFAGLFFVLLGVLCFVFNRMLGGWIRGLSLVAFGVKEKAIADDVIFRGLACVAGMLTAGMGLALLAGSLR
jgi:hypothetical protein